MSRDMPTSTRPAPRGDFWSRRKAAVAAEQNAERDAAQAEALARQEAALAERSDAEILAELDLPDPDEMERTEQVQELLKSAVPQRLKTRALRRMWRLNPVLANVDGLVDYGEDFTDAATVVENLQTAYQVGKGMLKTLEDWVDPNAAEDDAEGADDGADAEHAALDAAASDEEQPITPIHTETSQEAADRLEAAVASDADTLPARPRRMRFEFDPAT